MADEFDVTKGDLEEVGTVSPSDSVESGSGGDNLSIYSDGEVTLDEIDTSSATTYYNESGFPLESLVEPLTGEAQRTEITSVDSGVETGEGGGLINFFNYDAEGQASALESTGARFFVNESRVGLLGQFLTAKGSKESISTQASVTSDVKNESRRYLEGKISVSVGDTIVYSDTVDGRTSFGLPIPPYIHDGDEAPSSGLVYSVKFTPSNDGVSVIKNGLSENTNLQIVYKEVKGKVESNDNNPLSNETVLLGDYNTVTDTAGEFTVLAPIGEAFDVASLQGTSQREISIEEGDTSEYQIVFTYPGLRVVTEKPNGGGIQGAKVTYGSNSLTTDEQGIAEDNTLPLGSYTVRMFDYYEKDIIVNQEGLTFVLQFGGEEPDFSDPRTGNIVTEFDALSITVLDNVTSEQVANTDITIPGVGVSQSTDQGGKATIAVPPVVTAGSPVGAEYTAYVARDDERYTFSQVTGVVGEGESEDEVRLERETHTSQV